MTDAVFAEIQGIAEGLTYDEFREKYPEEFRKREKDKYHYRFLYGEVSLSSHQILALLVCVAIRRRSGGKDCMSFVGNFVLLTAVKEI